VSLKRGVWHISRECEGIAEAGGLKDVVAGLSEALVAEGIPSAVVLPRYGFVDLVSLDAERTGIGFQLPFPDGPESVEVYRCRRRGVPVYLLDSPRVRSKGAIYTYTGGGEAGSAKAPGLGALGRRSHQPDPPARGSGAGHGGGCTRRVSLS
jgi:glycogen synthase